MRAVEGCRGLWESGWVAVVERNATPQAERDTTVVAGGFEVQQIWGILPQPPGFCPP